MRIGRLYIDIANNELFYRHKRTGYYYDLIDPIERTPDYWCRRVKQLWLGFWWVCDPGTLERQCFYDLHAFLYGWWPAP